MFNFLLKLTEFTNNELQYMFRYIYYKTLYKTKYNN